MSGADWLAIAVIVRPHALRGAVQVKPFIGSARDFLQAPLEKVSLRRNGRVLKTVTIETMSLHKGLPLIVFKEVNDRNEAEDLKGVELVIPEEERWELPEGTYFPGELDGLEVVDQQTGEVLGTVLRLTPGVAHDHLVFTHPERESDEVMLPQVPQFVHQIDLKGRTVVVSLPEGLLDL